MMGTSPDFKPLPPDLVGHLDLKAVAAGMDVLQVDRLQGVRRKHLNPPVGSVKGMPVIIWTYLAALRLSISRRKGQLITRIPLQ